MTARTFFSLLIVGLFAYVASPLVIPVLMGAVFAVLFYPFQRWLVRRWFSQDVTSFLVTGGVTCGVLLPFAFLGFLAAKAVFRQIQAWKAAGPSGIGSLWELPGVRSVADRTASLFHVSPEEMMQTAEELARSAGIRAGSWLGDSLAQLPGAVVALAIMILSIYFFLADGERLVRWIRDASVFSGEQTDRFVSTFARMCRSVMLASLASGLSQALLFMLAAFVAGVGKPVLIGFLVFVFSFIPLVGTIPVTVALTLYGFIKLGTAAGVILLIGAVISAGIDNLIRPVVLRGAGNLHPLLGFVGAIGGMQMIGISGIFLGPVLAGLFVVTIRFLLPARDGQVSGGGGG